MLCRLTRIAVGLIVVLVVAPCLGCRENVPSSATVTSKDPNVAATSKSDDVNSLSSTISTSPAVVEPLDVEKRRLRYKPRKVVDSSGYVLAYSIVEPWPADASSKDVAERFKGAFANARKSMDNVLLQAGTSEDTIAQVKYTRASFRNYEGDPIGAYEDLCDMRKYVEKKDEIAQEMLYSVIYFQGISALRRGENENCVMCRGESSCILPIASSAIHTREEGSRLAIQHFSEYLDKFPDDLEVKWLMNVAYMTLGEYPQNVPIDRLINLERFYNNEFDLGKFRDIGHLIGVNHFNQAGGAIMDDFDNDGNLDIITTTLEPTGVMSFFVNNGKGSFDDFTERAGINDQYGGLNCVQTDYNNDGFKDVLIVRGAWLDSRYAMRPTLLRNNGNRTFTDVTIEAGLGTPINSISATWADYDNDGWLDVFVCCEKQPNRLYHNKQDGTFEEIAIKAGLGGATTFSCKGAAWLDYDNDGLQDIFLNHLSKAGGQLFHNKGNGTFKRVTEELGIAGPLDGFACWAWDYDNDGYQDIFATCYDKEVGEFVKGLIGQPHELEKNVLYRNREGRGFENVTAEAGLDFVLFTMGSNFGDFDNDGFLDMYLGTGDPNLGSLVPNRMFKNVAGQRFSDVTASSGTGNLQKGHGVACGDWDSDGNLDIFIEMGGAVNGDKYHNIMFQNPGHDANWINIRLVGEKTNRAAIGARIKVVTAGDVPQTFYRHISSGSSFGGNPLEQLVGIGNATKIESIEVTWPTSNTKQTFLNPPIGKFIEITEFAEDYKVLDRNRISLAR